MGKPVSIQKRIVVAASIAALTALSGVSVGPYSVSGIGMIPAAHVPKVMAVLAAVAAERGSMALPAIMEPPMAAAKAKKT